MSTSSTSSLTPSRSVTPPAPPPIAQPDHFFGSEGAHIPPSPNSDARPWLHPDDDPLAHRGIPVFKPTIDEFSDFEAYMTKIERWGLKSGIVKVIPPKEWVDALPLIRDQLAKVKIRSPIEQHMLGRGGLFRQENVEKRRVMSVREWAELCDKEDFRTPGIEDVGLHARSTRVAPRPPRRARPRVPSPRVESADPEQAPCFAVKEERGEPSMGMLVDEPHSGYMSPPMSVGNPRTPTADVDPLPTSTPCPGNGGDDPDAEDDGDHFADVDADQPEEKPKLKGKRTQTREQREANLAERAAKDTAFLQVFDPAKDWLPPGTTPEDYTIEFCQKLERQYWRNCGLGRPAWYGADTQGSLYTDETKVWNVAHLPSFLSRILPSSSNGLPGVNLPYLYFGMWRATFAWHVEDMDLFSINYIHFGAPKFWYAIPQGRATALESTMKSYFPKDTSQCPQFLRHKSFLASPTLLAQSSCRPNFLVQREHEFVITYPRGYHAGFNLGFNCAESVNFALESWVELGRRAKACQCISDSVRIDVDQLLHDREVEMLDQPAPSSKRKAEALDSASKRKRPKPTAEPVASASPVKVSVTLKIGPRPPEPEAFPCCLCVSMSQDGLLPVQDPPIGKRELPASLSSIYDATRWMAHEECAKVVPETWVDTVELAETLPDGSYVQQSRVFGVDAVVKDRWNLKCSACTKGRQKAHGAPIQCTKGKCTKSFHVSCAREGQNGVSYSVLREVEKEVILVDHSPPAPSRIPHAPGEPSQSEPTAGGGVPRDPLPTTDVEPLVLKTIKKNEVQLLCNQHNPAVAAAKKANKQDKIRNELLALPSMSRIKIRMSAGVFEVSLVRVIEETKSIEVLWDRGVKREFKWGSVMFGQVDGQTVMQKPSEPAPEPTPPRRDATPTLHVATFPPSVPSSSASSTSTPTPAPPPMYMPTYHYQPPSTVYATGSWSYQMCQAQQVPYPVAYSYPGYYPAAMQASYAPPVESAGVQGPSGQPHQAMQP